MQLFHLTSSQTFFRLRSYLIFCNFITSSVNAMLPSDSPHQRSRRHKSELSSSESPTSLNLKFNEKDLSWHTASIPHHSSKNEGDTDIQRQPLKNPETTPLFYASYPYSECQPNLPFSSKPSISLNLKPNGEAFLWSTGSQKLYIPHHPSKNEENTDNNRERSHLFDSPRQHNRRRKSVVPSSEPPTPLNLKFNEKDLSWHTASIPHHSSKNEEDTDMEIEQKLSIRPLNALETSPLPFSPHSYKALKTGTVSSSESGILGDLNLAKDFAWNTSKLDIKEKEEKENKNKRRNSENYYVGIHPLTRALWKKRDVSTRVKELREYNKKTIKNLSNAFEKEDLEYYKKVLSYNDSDDIPIPGLSMIKLEDLEVNSMNPKNANSENSHAEVIFLSYSDDKIAIKKFTDLQLGFKDLFRSLEALEMNPAPHKLKMAGIFDAVINPHNELGIIMEGAETLELEKCLCEPFAQYAITACAKYLAKLHIKSDKKLASKPITKKKCIENLGNPRNRENYIENLANANKTLSYDLLKAETTETELLFLNAGSPRKDENQYTGPINAGTIFRSLPLIYRDAYEILARKVIKSFIDVSHEIYRSLNDFFPNFYLITATHGDAHLGNFFYNHLADAQKISWDSSLRICAIDYASMARSINGDNPAVDVARLAASIEAKGYFELSSLFYKTYEDKIVKSEIIENIEKYKNTFKESYDFFYLRFLKTIFNLPQEKMADQTKIDLLKRWIDENSAHLPPEQEIENNIIHCLPDPLEIFIPSGHEGSLTYLEQLHIKITPESPIAILTGLTGVGKKSLALEFAHRELRSKNYNLIYWIPSATNFSLLKAYKNLLLDFGIPVHDKTENEIIELVKQQVSQKGPCLFIYASVPNAAFLKDKIPADVFTIITSRDPEDEQWKRLFPHAKLTFLKIDVFRPEESRQYLYKATGLESTVKAASDSANDSIIDSLAELLGHRPLDLATAASSIRLNSDDNINILNNFQNYFYNIKKYSIIHGDPFKKESSQPIDENIIDKL